MSEIEELKEDVKEIKADQKEMICAVNDLKVLVAGQYVTKNEFTDHLKEDSTTHRWFAGTLVTIGIFVFGLIIQSLT